MATPTTARHRALAAPRRTLLALTALAATAAHGAGGHHAVDDASILEAGQCEFETWFERERHGARTLLHAGAACRVAAVELGLQADRERLDGGASASVGAQLKWARPIGGGWSGGVVIIATAQEGTPRYAGSTIVLPLSWQATETLFLHANVGRDLLHRERDANRAGIGLEWSPAAGWTLLGERFRELGDNHWRAGVRWSVTPALSLDLSRTDGLHGRPAPWWTIGATWLLAR